MGFGCLIQATIFFIALNVTNLMAESTTKNTATTKSSDNDRVCLNDTDSTDGQFQLASEMANSETCNTSDNECHADDKNNNNNNQCLTETMTTTTQPPKILDCGVYMAPSTLASTSTEDANLGIFTAKPLQPGTVVPYPEIVIPLLFRNWDRHPDMAYGDGILWDRYVWDGAVSNVETYNLRDFTQQRAVFVPGVGCTVNSLLDLNNVESTHGSIYDALVPRKDPAAGSFSPYHGSETTASRFIPAGTELMASYGKTWIPWIPNIPVMQEEYMQQANQFLIRLHTWIREMQLKHGTDLTPQLLERLWQLIRNFPHKSKSFPVLPSNIDWEAVLSTTSPMTMGGQEKSHSNSGTGSVHSGYKITSLPLDVRNYWRDKLQVSIEWLQQHGKCQDHMRPGKSTIPNAGRGAFATRDLPKGTIVGYAPLIHVAERFDQFATIPYNHHSYHYASDNHFNSNYSTSRTANMGYSKPDLIINYSFGHANSTLLLTPYGAMVNYINHHKYQANVRLQWPTKELVAHKPDWLYQSVEYLRHTTKKIGLSLEYVALRDIQEGEEIFLDYGDEWQAAWDEHVASWVPPPDAESYVHSTNYQIDVLKTIKEQRSDPYPPNLVTVCKESYKQQGSQYVWVPVLRDWQDYVPCDVLDRRGDKYTVKLYQTSRGETVTVYKVPRDQGIKLVDRVYSQDWHLPLAFRHKIAIPDDIFPPSWMNLVESKEVDG